MHKYIIAFLLFISSAAYAQENQQFFKTTEINLGKVKPKNGKVTAVFHYTNNTGKTVVIKKTETACNCTSVIYPKHPIRPNERGEVRVEIDLKQKAGYFFKTVLIQTNALKATILKVKGLYNH